MCAAESDGAGGAAQGVSYVFKCMLTTMASVKTAIMGIPR